MLYHLKNFGVMEKLMGDEVEEKLKNINDAWRELETEIGYKVTEEDIWSWHARHKRNLKT